MKITENRLRNLIKSIIKESEESVEKNSDFIKRLNLAIDSSGEIDMSELGRWNDSVNPDGNKRYDGRKSGWGGGGALFGNATNTRFNQNYYDFGLSAVLEHYNIPLFFEPKSRYVPQYLKKMKDKYEMFSDEKKLSNLEKFIELFENMYLDKKGDSKQLDANNKTFSFLLRTIVMHHKKLDAHTSQQQGYGAAGVSEIERSEVSLSVLKKIVHEMEKSLEQVKEAHEQLSDRLRQEMNDYKLDYGLEDDDSYDGHLDDEALDFMSKYKKG